MNLGILFKTLRSLWRVGLLRMNLGTAWRILKVWRHCPGSFSFLADMAALRFGDATALIDDEGPMSYSELRDTYEVLAHTLIADFGIMSSSKVAVIERNQRTFIIAILAAARTGADILLINPGSPPKVMDKLLSSHVIDAVLYGTDVDIGTYAQALPRMVLTVAPLTEGHTFELPPSKRAGELQVLTSGSTGSAKKIDRRPTLASLLPTVLGLLRSIPIAMHKPTILAIPLFHGYGLSTLAMALAFASPLHFGREVDIAPLLHRYSMSEKPIVVSIPTLLQRWMNARGIVDSVAAVITGSAPLDRKLCERLIHVLGPVLYNLYGSSEAGVISIAMPDMLSAAPGTVGKPLPGNVVNIVDLEGKPVPPQIVGRILVRGPLVLKADSNGWLDTGDLGRIDGQQRLFVCGRSDDMFVSGGENVYPQEVEACLRDHPLIEAAAVAVVEDAEFGHRMHAFIVVCKGNALTSDLIRKWLIEKVDRFKIPKNFEIVQSLPRNPLGKIDRQAIMEVTSTQNPLV